MRASLGRNSSIIWYLLLIVVLAMSMLPQFYLFSHITDDAYISFRYADRLAHGKGLTFNPGEKVEGFSNPLWTLIISVLVYLTSLPTFEIAKFLGILCSMLTFICVWKIFRQSQSDFESSIANFGLFSVMLLVNPGFHVYMTAGLEGPLLMFLLTAGVSLSLAKKSSHNYVSAIVFGLVSITRPEGLLYALLWFVFTFRKINTKSTLGQELLRLLMIFLPWVFYQSFRMLYFNDFLPNTFTAKPPGAFGGDKFGIGYLLPWLGALGGFVTIGLISILKINHSKQDKAIFKSCAGLIITSIIFVVYARGDWMPFGRFTTPIWPIVCLCLITWIQSVLEKLNEYSLIRLPGIAKVIIAIGIIFSSILVWTIPIIQYGGNHDINMLMRGHDQAKVGKWLTENVREGTTVATFRLGGISYFAPKMIFWDLYGLTDKEEAKFISRGRPGGNENDPVLKRVPKILALVSVSYSPSGGEGEEKKMRKWVDKHYSFIKAFPQGNWGTFDIWILKGTTDIMINGSLIPSEGQ